MHDPAERSRRHIAVLARADASDPRAWSGTPFFSARALARHAGAVSHLGPMPAWPELAEKVRAKVRARLGGGRGLPRHTALLAHVYGRLADQRLAGLKPPADLVFAPAGSVMLARLRSLSPVAYSSDTTVRLMFDYYPRFTGLSEAVRRSADAIERDAIARADLLLYPTRWAADSAIADYGADPTKVHILPYGANLEEAPEAPRLDVPEGDTCRLLLVGVDWAVKGAAIALGALEALRARGVAAELTIVGCTPPEPVERPGLTIIPFLDKREPESRARLEALYRGAHFLILPTRCECYGLVFCEAAAYGVPAIATRTGGVPELVLEDETGHTLPLEAGGGAYAERIAALWADRARYRAMRRASREGFETRLNWDVWGRSAAEAIETLLARRAAA
ncbi:hypothetical protein BH23PSE1_BH23PSE1_02490 [soil metagenome]